MSKDDNSKDDAKVTKSSVAKVGTIAVSSSLAVIMTSAMAQAASNHVVKIDGDAEVSDEMAQAITNAIGKRSIRDAVSDTMAILVTGIEKDGQTLSEKYLDSKTLGDWLVAQGQVLVTPGSGGDANLKTNKFGNSPAIPNANCYTNCHNACHSACHGSRGWR